jgi:uncharacterized membrane protein
LDAAVVSLAAAEVSDSEAAALVVADAAEVVAEVSAVTAPHAVAESSRDAAIMAVSMVLIFFILIFSPSFRLCLKLTNRILGAD